MGNSNHDERGRFSSSSGNSGDPSKEAANTRTVPGHGTVPRSKVVARHAGEQSVGTGGGRLSAAARDYIIRNKGIDQRRYGVATDASVGLKTTLQGPPRTPGKLDPHQFTFVSGGAKPRVRAKN